MKARELIALLQNAPEADVMQVAVFVGEPPMRVTMEMISLNNEANAWIIDQRPWVDKAFLQTLGKWKE